MQAIGAVRSLTGRRIGLLTSESSRQPSRGFTGAMKSREEEESISC